MLSVALQESSPVLAPRAKYLPPRLVKLIADAAEAFHLEPADVLGPSRLKNHAAARHVVMWALRETWAPQPSWHEIGRLLERDHTTIIGAVRRIAREIGRGSPLGQMALKIAGVAPLVPPALRLITGGDAPKVQLEFEFDRELERKRA